MSETSVDNDLYFKKHKNELMCLIGQFVDNSFEAGKDKLFKKRRKLYKNL